MAVTTYSPVTWGGEDIDLSKLKQMANNDQFLFENLPKMIYKGPITKAGGLKIACGKVAVPPKNSRQSTVEVYFGSFFTTGCAPVVTANARTGGATYGNRKTVSIGGIGRVDPDHRGVALTYNTIDELDRTAIKQARTVGPSALIHWIAVGW